MHWAPYILEVSDRISHFLKTCLQFCDFLLLVDVNEGIS